LDTRKKIVDAAQAARIAQSGATVVSGYFDPLIAAHAERLRQLKREGAPLLILIRSAHDPILPARARAELVAGLAIVDHVCEAPNGIAPDISLEDEDQARLARLIDHVQTRQRSASGS
jgi:bifunctional ADP-heptose synthase (sugar kinase/adenylyltransferase)